MRQQSKLQKDTMERVMHESKHGELKARGGRKVTSRRQAIAIGLNEAGATKYYKSKQENERSQRRTKRTEERSDTGRAKPKAAETTTRQPAGRHGQGPFMPTRVAAGLTAAPG